MSVIWGKNPDKTLANRIIRNNCNVREVSFSGKIEGNQAHIFSGKDLWTIQVQLQLCTAQS